MYFVVKAVRKRVEAPQLLCLPPPEELRWAAGQLTAAQVNVYTAAKNTSALGRAARKWMNDGSSEGNRRTRSNQQDEEGRGRHSTDDLISALCFLNVSKQTRASVCYKLHKLLEDEPELYCSESKETRSQFQYLFPSKTICNSLNSLQFVIKSTEHKHTTDLRSARKEQRSKE